MGVHPASLAVCRIELARVNDGERAGCSALATAFFWRFAQKRFLVTNWHNVTGLNPDTGKMNGSFLPTHMAVEFKFIVEGTDQRSLVGSSRFEMPLQKNSLPVWIEHPRREAVDCVAIDVTSLVNDLCLPKTMNDCSFEHALEPWIGMDAFIVGYPDGVAASAKTPIWKRASIASEPSLNHDGKRVFLVDSASRPGMSGSPVIVRHNGYFDPDGGTVVSDNGIIGTIENFCGVYSGRIADDALGFQLGRVWKRRNIEEIFLGGVAGHA